MAVIKCLNCGEVLPDDSNFCVKCGAKLDVSINDETSKKTKNKKLIVGIAAVIGIIVICFVFNYIQTSNLKNELKRGWERVEGENGAYIMCILDFSDDDVEYRLETGYKWMDTTIATYEYKVISGNKFKASRYGSNWETFTIEFNSDKNMMTVRPALTSVDEEEVWFNLD